MPRVIRLQETARRGKLCHHRAMSSTVEPARKSWGQGWGLGGGVDLSMETVDRAKSSVEDRIKKNLHAVCD